ncbi:MAG: hypothetical protein GWP10_02125 [Nitrospiraceae bacterium]|nr:hypothetical protein [Nitrospiraceae bacterium]
MMKDAIRRISLIILAISFVFCPVCVQAALHKTEVAVLPIDIRLAGPFSYIGHATEEVLSTRLASDRISVVDPLEVRDLIEEKSISSLKTKDIAHRLGVDYVVIGKVTTKGKGIAMALDLMHIGSTAPLLSLAFSPKSLNEVLPEVEGFAKQARGHILGSPQPLEAPIHAPRNEGSAQQGGLEEKTAEDKDLMISRMHPDLLIRSSLKTPGRTGQSSMSLDRKIYARALLIPPPRPLKIPKIELAKKSRILPPVLPTPKSPAKKEGGGWFSWIREFWGNKEAFAQEPPRPALPYPPPEPGTEQAGPSNEPIWQWY